MFSEARSFFVKYPVFFSICRKEDYAKVCVLTGQKVGLNMKERDHSGVCHVEEEVQNIKESRRRNADNGCSE